jgi:hypothetical protein
MTTMPDPEARFRQLFAALAERADLKQRESPSFGDYEVIATSDEIEVRLLSDRGQESVDIRPAGESEWFDLALLQMILTGGDTLNGLDADSLARFLDKHLVDVRRALDGEKWPSTKQQIQSLERQRVRRRFGTDQDTK